jgi:hypothetical protein
MTKAKCEGFRLKENRLCIEVNCIGNGAKQMISAYVGPERALRYYSIYDINNRSISNSNRCKEEAIG